MSAPTKLTPKHYQDAIDLQNASNPSGVIHTLSDIANAVWNEPDVRAKGTEAFAHHPIIRLLVYKLFCLCFCEPIGKNTLRYIDKHYCEALAMAANKANETD